MFAYILGLIAGLAQPTQTSINGKLGEKVKSTYLVSVISFSTSVLLLVAITAILEGGIHIPFVDIAREPWWIWCGGFCGVGIVICSVLCLPKIGSAMTVVLTSFGQIITGLVVDQFGAFHSPQIGMTATRTVGALIVMAAVFIMSGPYGKKNSGQRYPFAYMVLAFFVGVLCGIQIGINGTLGSVAGSSWVGTLISMTVGLTGSTLLFISVYLIKGKTAVFKEGRDIEFKWYMVTGGLLGVIIVGSNAITAPIIGTGMVSVMNLVGFMLGGLVIDAAGFLGIEKKPVTLSKIIGVVTMIVGTVIITLL